MLLGTLLFLCLTSVVKADAYARDGIYPLTMDSYGRLMVGARVNGYGIYPFIIDTGAGRSIFYRTLTAEIGLEAIPNKSRRVITAAGYKRVQIYPVQDFYVLGQSLGLSETVTLPDISGSEARGLVGVDLLMGRTLLIRPLEMTVNLFENAETVSAMGWPYEQGRPVAVGSLALEIEVGGITIPVLVDTGASDTVINKAGAETLLRSGSGIQSERTTAVVARGQNVAREKLIISNIAFAERAFSESEIYVADIAIFRLLGAQRVPAIILGMDVLGQQGFAVDFKSWRLYLEPNTVPIVSNPAGTETKE